MARCSRSDFLRKANGLWSFFLSEAGFELGSPGKVKITNYKAPALPLCSMPGLSNLLHACIFLHSWTFWFAHLDFYKNKPGLGLNPQKTWQKISTIIAHSRFFAKIFAHFVKRLDTPALCYHATSESESKIFNLASNLSYKIYLFWHSVANLILASMTSNSQLVFQW